MLQGVELMHSGIAVYGTNPKIPITALVIDGNEVHHLKTGSSESLVVNGNVTDFRITDNVVHDNNNIGIDIIGFERTSPDPATDQARDGVVGRKYRLQHHLKRQSGLRRRTEFRRDLRGWRNQDRDREKTSFTTWILESSWQASIADARPAMSSRAIT